MDDWLTAWRDLCARVLSVQDQEAISELARQLVAIFENYWGHPTDYCKEYVPSIFLEHRMSEDEYQFLVELLCKRFRSEGGQSPSELVWGLGVSFNPKSTPDLIKILVAALQEDNEELAWQSLVALDKIAQCLHSGRDRPLRLRMIRAIRPLKMPSDRVGRMKYVHRCILKTLAMYNRCDEDD